MVTAGRLPFDRLWRNDLVQSFVVGREERKALAGPFLTFEEAEAVMWTFRARYPDMHTCLLKYEAAPSELESGRKWFSYEVESGFIYPQAPQKSAVLELLVGIMYAHGWGVEYNEEISKYHLGIASRQGCRLMDSTTAKSTLDTYAGSRR
jgi:hypothetical protein